ncbi:MAG TPA: TonB family protein [bacterium]
MPGNAASAPAISDPAQAGADSTAGQPISGLQSPDGQAGQQQAASPAEGASRPTDQRHTPVLTPPVLLTASEAASSQSAQVTLDRTMLTPQLRITALEGRVVLAVLVRVDGSVGWVRIESSSGIDPLDTAAVKAAEIWRFRPATRDGVSTESWAIIAVRFVLP